MMSWDEAFGCRKGPVRVKVGRGGAGFAALNVRQQFVRVPQHKYLSHPLQKLSGDGSTIMKLLPLDEINDSH